MHHLTLIVLNDFITTDLTIHLHIYICMYTNTYTHIHSYVIKIRNMTENHFSVYQTPNKYICLCIYIHIYTIYVYVYIKYDSM